MLKSMTGFGRCELSENNKKITVEMKSVNHRYLDISIKMPKKFNPFEASIRRILQEYCKRGKLDVYIAYEDLSEGNYQLKYNEELARQYWVCLSAMSEKFQIPNDLTSTALSKYPDILTIEEQEIDADSMMVFLEKAVRKAAEQFAQARDKEGESLRNNLLAKLEHLSSILSYIEKKSPEIIDTYQKRLEEKVQNFLQEAAIDENRILAEVTIFADKCCVDEELVRLRSHVDTTQDMLIKGGSIGRNLDFIIQEMNREANTILSKSNDLDISNQGIALKTEIEKIREQVQNIE
ncbi:MAG: YicC family protein [Lachnospiraceae bacterium]|nr:YicC family protein [Lachnospiraceae bacterium]